MPLGFLDRAGQRPCRHGHDETGKDDPDKAYHDTKDSADWSDRRYVSVSDGKCGNEGKINRMAEADFFNYRYQNGAG